MSCPVKIQSINYLQKKNVITNKREITDISSFHLLNDKLTDHAYFKYGVGGGTQKLFDIDTQEVVRADGSYRTLFRAVPNEKLFNALQEQISNDLKDKEEVKESATLFRQPKPIVTFNGVSAAQLVDMPDPIAAKKMQEKLAKDIEDFNDLINCLWA